MKAEATSEHAKKECNARLQRDVTFATETVTAGNDICLATIHGQS